MRVNNSIRQMTSTERRAVLSLSSIYAFRMLGLFMILPVFVLYAEGLTGFTPTLAGVAIGIYGLTQALLQIPFGMLSDRFGRKPLIILGLIIFALGSVIAAQSTSIVGVIIGRALQGSGAISAVLMAMTADLTREEHRLKAMAMIGMTIGFSFALSLVLGPVVSQWFGLSGIFWLTTVFALFGIVIVSLWVPTPVRLRFHRDAQPVPAQFKKILKDRQLLRLDFGIFILHMILTASFVVLPLVLRDYANLDVSMHWYVYLPVLLLSVALMIPFIIIAEAKRRMKQVFVSAILILCLSEVAFAFLFESSVSVFIILVAYFAAFNLLEASLPSLISKMSPADSKGTAMGIYSSSQFFGAFVGGALGGWIYSVFGLTAVFSFCAVVAGIWFLVAVSMQNPRYLSSYMINVGQVDQKQAQQMVVNLTQIKGVAEAIVIPEDQIAYLKVDLHALDEDTLSQFSVTK